MTIPQTYTDVNETDCCAVPNVKDWDKQHINFDNRHFIRGYTKSIFHMPINMGKVLGQLNMIAESRNHSSPEQEAMILSREISPWKAEQLYSVKDRIEGADNVTLNGEFISLVFEGPYKNARKWDQELQDHVKNEGKEIKNSYFFYTTCPKCAKHYGKNYVIGLAQV